MAHYSLFSRWIFDGPLEPIWEATADIRRWPEWWPGVREVSLARAGDDAGLGASYRVVLQSKLPYKVLCEAEVTGREPLRSQTYTLLSGDLQGVVTWRYERAEGSTVVRYAQNVETRRPWMHHLDPVLRPAFTWNHQELMRLGGEGLARLAGCRCVKYEAGASPNLDIFLLIHEAMRRESAHFASDPAPSPALRRRFERFRSLTSEHHTSEDTVFFPWVAGLAPASADAIRALELQHAHLDAAMRAYDDALSSAERSPAARTDAALAARALAALVDEHLDAEEKVFVPAVEDHATEQSLARIEQRAMKNIRPRDLAVLVPWVLDGLDHERERAVVAKMPLPLALLYRHRWKASYARGE